MSDIGDQRAFPQQFSLLPNPNDYQPNSAHTAITPRANKLNEVEIK
jgi:hypothetical protein